MKHKREEEKERYKRKSRIGSRSAGAASLDLMHDLQGAKTPGTSSVADITVAVRAPNRMWIAVGRCRHCSPLQSMSLTAGQEFRDV